MKIYIVTREGIYRHEILGLYLDPKESEKNAYLAISSAKDDYMDKKFVGLTNVCE